MSNQQTVIMVPAKAVRQDLKTETNTIVYMPLATTENPGVVQIGKGLIINDKGLLTFDENEISILKIAKNGEIILPDINKVVNITLNKSDVGLNNVDNTSDINKPVSTYQQQALDNKLNKHLGVENSNKVLYVNEYGYVDYTTLGSLKVLNDGFVVSNITETINFSDLFVLKTTNGKDVIIDGADSLKTQFINVDYNSTNGVLTFTRANGTVARIDLPLELLIKSGYYDEETDELVLVLANDQLIKIPVGQLVNHYYPDDVTLELIAINNKLTFKLKDEGVTTEKIKNGAVTNDKILSLSGEKVIGDVSSAMRAKEDFDGNDISTTYQKIDNSYSKLELDVLLSNKADVSQLPVVIRIGGV